MKRLVFHIISLEDTLDFKPIYENLKDTKVLINPDKKEIKTELIENQDTDVIFLGHGDHKGLYDKNMKEYCVNHEIVELLKNRFVIGIWCFAAEFADRYGLHGFFTSDFISNEKEFHNTFTEINTLINDEDIHLLNRLFSLRLFDLINSEINPSLWVNKLQQEVSHSLVEKYNYEALSYYE